MTNFKLTNLETLVNLVSINEVKIISKPSAQNQVDSFFYPEADIPQQSALIDRHLEQICNIY